MEWASALVSALGEHEAPCNDEPPPYYQGTPSTRERHSRLMAQTSCPSQKPGAFAPELRAAEPAVHTTYSVSTALANAAIDGNSQSGVTSAGGAGVAPQPGRS